MKYVVRRVPLSSTVYRSYYEGFAIEAIWPLIHNVGVEPIFREDAWEAFNKVNTLFADAIQAGTVDRDSVVYVHDFHFGLLPRLLRSRGFHGPICLFWHSQWLAADTLRKFPWRREYVTSMLASTCIGFLTEVDLHNFMELVHVEKLGAVNLPARRIDRSDGVTRLFVAPSSVDFDNIVSSATTATVEEEMQLLHQRYRLDRCRLLFGIDRLDYSKGIPQRLIAFRDFLEQRPEMRGHLVFAQVASPTRENVEAYRLIAEETERLSREINERYGTSDWTPVILIRENVSEEIVLAHFRMASVCVVTPLRDGLNLVAKEFVAARIDERGVLLLSPYAGCSYELQGAVFADPYEIADLVNGLRIALEMKLEEQQERMRRLRAQVQVNNIFLWNLKLVESADD